MQLTWGYSLLIATLIWNEASALAATGHDGVMLEQASELLKGIQVPPTFPWREFFNLSTFSTGKNAITPEYWYLALKNSLAVNFKVILTVVPLWKSQLSAVAAQPSTSTAFILQLLEPVNHEKLIPHSGHSSAFTTQQEAPVQSWILPQSLYITAWVTTTTEKNRTAQKTFISLPNQLARLPTQQTNSTEILSRV